MNFVRYCGPQRGLRRQVGLVRFDAGRILVQFNGKHDKDGVPHGRKTHGWHEFTARDLRFIAR